MIYLAIFFTGIVIGAALACIVLSLLPDYHEDLPGGYGPEHDFSDRDAEHRAMDWRSGDGS